MNPTNLAEQLQEQINGLVLEIVITAHDYMIRELGELEYHTESPNLSFYDETSAFTMIYLCDFEISSSGGTFFLELGTNGALQEVLEEHDYEPKLQATLINQKLRKVLFLDDAAYLRKQFYQVTAQMKQGKEPSVAGLEALKDKLEEFFVFYKLKFS